VGLNKGETLHSQARDIVFGQQGRFTVRGYEAQLNRASALSLVINAIVVWKRNDELITLHQPTRLFALVSALQWFAIWSWRTRLIR
jgi:hypothetical protein